MEMDDDALLQQALALSMQGAVVEPTGDAPSAEPAGQAPSSAPDAMLMEGIDDPELQQALALSMQMAEEEATKKDEKDENAEKEE